VEIAEALGVRRCLRSVGFRSTIVFAIIAMLIFGALLRARQAASEGADPAAGNSIENPLAGGPNAGDEAPNFSLPDLNGRMHSPSDFRGRPVVVGFFCGCDRCHAAALKIAALQRRAELKNFVAVVGMDANGASAFQRSTGLRGQILIDLSDTAADRYDSEFCPRLWRIDASGKIAYRTRGALAGAELAGSLAELVHPDAKVHGA